jgi:Probable cobalt transporter subunit (CbtA)
MVRALLIRGMLAGVLAGLLAFGFAKIFGEPQVDHAIAFETLLDQAKSHTDASKAASGASDMSSMNMSGGMSMSNTEAAEPALVSRQTQAGLGLFTGVVVYGAAFGGLFALVFAFAYGRIGSLSPRGTAALLAGAAFLALVVVPGLKYPANPPAVGRPETIGERTGFFLIMIIASIAALVIAAWVGRRLAPRLGGWNASFVGGAVFIVLVAVVQILLPAINEVPDQFPAVLLWRFRIASLGIEAILWTTIGLVFGVLAEKVLARGRWSPSYA